MAVYEEKLISPLAVRFSQEHVRNTFRNGMNLEAAVGLVEVQTFQGPKDPESPHNYDLVLKPPFPNIEIVRWAPPEMRNKQNMPMVPTQHWYTRDNRRLYVLQRAATKYWPKKVAVEADVLSAVPNGLRKKYDSSTAGLLVALGDSAEFSPSTFVWHWGHAVTNVTGKNLDMAKEKSAFQQLKQDDLSSSLAQLVSLATGRRFDPLHKLPGFSSDDASASSEPKEVTEVAEVEAAGADKAQKETVSQEKQEKQEKGQQGKGGKGMNGGKKGKDMKEDEAVKATEERPKTKEKKAKKKKKNRKAAKAPAEIEESSDESSDSELDWSQWWPDFDEHWDRVVNCLDGVWKGPKGETYQMWFEEPGEEEVRGYCAREQKKSNKTFSVRGSFHHVSERFLFSIVHPA